MRKPLRFAYGKLRAAAPSVYLVIDGTWQLSRLRWEASHCQQAIEGRSISEKVDILLADARAFSP